MNKLLIALTALVLSTAGTLAFADDVKTGGKTTETEGRQLDEVKTGGKTTDTQGREMDEVKEGGKTTDTQGRKLDEKKKKK